MAREELFSQDIIEPINSIQAFCITVRRNILLQKFVAKFCNWQNYDYRQSTCQINVRNEKI